MKIFLDTETTGLYVEEGHRIVELGLVRSDGMEKQWYFNPEREVSSEAEKVHGLSDERLRDEPKFSEKVEEILAFIQNSVLVAHHSQFDISFLNHELKLAGRKPLENQIQDTLAIAREKFSSEKCSLLALCKKFGIDVSGRTKHGALIDAHLLAQLYPYLTAAVVEQGDISAVVSAPKRAKIQFERRIYSPTKEEFALHKAFLGKFMKTHLWH